MGMSEERALECGYSLNAYEMGFQAGVVKELKHHDCAHKSCMGRKGVVACLGNIGVEGDVYL